jgi:hypothetical protein
LRAVRGADRVGVSEARAMKPRPDPEPPMPTATRIVDSVNEASECYTPRAKTVMVCGIPVELILDARGHLIVTCGDETTSGDWSRVYGACRLTGAENTCRSLGAASRC